MEIASALACAMRFWPRAYGPLPLGPQPRRARGTLPIAQASEHVPHARGFHSRLHAPSSSPLVSSDYVKASTSADTCPHTVPPLARPRTDALIGRPHRRNCPLWSLSVIWLASGYNLRVSLALAVRSIRQVDEPYEADARHKANPQLLRDDAKTERVNWWPHGPVPDEMASAREY